MAAKYWSYQPEGTFLAPMSRAELMAVCIGSIKRRNTARIGFPAVLIEGSSEHLTMINEF
jgi:hypothetical protein